MTIALLGLRVLGHSETLTTAVGIIGLLPYQVGKC